ncbi:hypothetical protein QJS66_21175 [Kocuria rhizophila]|nr:hypothetical protein QJS66_21175 [Kocuria rhizophila]
MREHAGLGVHAGGDLHGLGPGGRRRAGVPRRRPRLPAPAELLSSRAPVASTATAASGRWVTGPRRARRRCCSANALRRCWPPRPPGRR